MLRPLRIEYEGAVYHVTTRGNERAKIFFTKADSRKFKDYIAAAKDKFDLVLHTYVVMPDHPIIETPAKNSVRSRAYTSIAFEARGTCSGRGWSFVVRAKGVSASNDLV